MRRDKYLHKIKFTDVLNKLRRWDEALLAFNQAIAINPKGEARQQFEQAINLNNSSAEPQLALAVTLYSQGEQEKALLIAEKALQLDKQFADVEFLKENLWGEKIIADTKKINLVFYF